MVKLKHHHSFSLYWSCPTCRAFPTFSVMPLLNDAIDLFTIEFSTLKGFVCADLIILLMMSQNNKIFLYSAFQFPDSQLTEWFTHGVRSPIPCAVWTVFILKPNCQSVSYCLSWGLAFDVLRYFSWPGRIQLCYKFLSNPYTLRLLHCREYKPSF